MKKLFINLFILGILLLSNKAWAYQEVYDVTVIDTKIDHHIQTCTITIANNHPVTNRTAGCNQKRFSWRCVDRGDYRLELSEQSKQNGYKMDIRYSEYQCDRVTNNMLLLTVW